MKKRVLFDKYRESDGIHDIESETNYMDVFCTTFLLSGHLQALSPSEYNKFREEFHRLFNNYNELYPDRKFSKFDVDNMLEDIQSGRPGSATDFAKRISPNSYLSSTFLQLKSIVSNDRRHASPNQKCM